MDNPYLKLDAIFERVKSATRKGGVFFNKMMCIKNSY